MYVQETESAAQKWCQANRAEVPQLGSVDDMVSYVTGESHYRVERSFDRLPQGVRELLLTIANVDFSDLKTSHCTGAKLKHYTQEGQLKIARAFRKVRSLSAMFPQGITEREFLQIDRAQGE